MPVACSAMGRAWPAAETVSTGEDRRPEHHPSLRKESAMKSLVLVAKSLLLSLLIAGSAFAADKDNINTADAATIADRSAKRRVGQGWVRPCRSRWLRDN